MGVLDVLRSACSLGLVTLSTQSDPHSSVPSEIYEHAFIKIEIKTEIYIYTKLVYDSDVYRKYISCPEQRKARCWVWSQGGEGGQRGGEGCPMCPPLPPSSIIADPLNTHSRSRLYTGGEVRGCK